MSSYRLYYRNQEWLYSVYSSDEQSELILVAIVPAVGWSEIAMVLNAAEVNTLNSDKKAFTELVNEFLHSRDIPYFKQRRIESRIVNVDTDTIRVVSGKI